MEQIRNRCGSVNWWEWTMSMEISVFFHGKLPDLAALTGAMKDLGLPLSVAPDDGSLEQQSGFMPMLFNGQETGVEFDVFEGREDLEDRLDGRELDPRFHGSANFRLGGDMNEMGYAKSGAAARAKLVDGVVFDTEGELLTPEQALASAKRGMEAVVKPR